MWYNFFKRKKDMGMKEIPLSKLKDDVEQQRNAIALLASRLSAMRDEVEELKNDVLKLRENVVEDVKYLYERVK
jgi:division protein CdvB (Snf7/Vps24/ESCRT-III family)